ncbi:uncharacterized protein F4822DRAFT_417381 [Hypoxylon trugodes]|uniref:uncharacterized protein n=1 Tax=Hypoxylon trugodes TaxID=326681 RepID=UPI00219C35C0|nr:uncharacterized protein F4822DRAFT_417381 [Hypoxylon trugodes]KAI1383723.1 hypothetical protein F4822DRAFT_417381 [Hypoxylon trugodes]
MTESAARSTIANMLELIDRLRGLEDYLFPTPEFGASGKSPYEDEVSTDGDEEITEEAKKPYEPTMLWHDNISLDNILVDQNGVLCGVIDWDCVSCLPLYEACQFPAFLQQGQDRLLEPLTPYTITRKQLDANKDLPRYNKELRQHQLTQLRRLFIAEMTDKCPTWVEIFRNRVYLRDYECAVQNCDNEFAYKCVEEWVDMMEKRGKDNMTVGRLHDRLMR